MIILKIISCIMAGFILSGIWFGSNLLLNLLFQKNNLPFMMHFITILASIMPLAIIRIFMGLYPIQINRLTNMWVYVIAVLTVFLTVLIITQRTARPYREGKELLLYGLDGVFMEVPQRLMMQSFVFGFLRLLKVSNANYFAIIITAIVWCLSICVQCLICKTKFRKDTLWEVLSSFVFSIGIGFVYQQTGFILITMLAHFSERIFSSLVFNKTQKKD
jgi:hypothetical protein